MAAWHLSLLGGVRLHSSSAEHSRFATRAIAALLVRLALWPQRDHPREELIELLWPGVDLHTGRRRLRQALSLLRAVLEPPQAAPAPVLQATRLSVRIVPGTIECDVHRLEALLRTGQRQAALACYRGEFMPGYFDEWIHDERLRLAGLHERLASELASELAQDPAHERGPQRRAAAAQPSASTHWPERTSPDSTPRTRLPGYLTRYFSNAGLSARLARQVVEHRLVTVLGPGGSGKTRLAVHLAERLSRTEAALATGEPASPFGLVVFVPLASVETADQMLGAVQSALQISSSEAALDTLLARLEGLQALLVLDNAEQLAGVANDVVERLTSALPQLHLLVTSRRPLGLAGEREFQIEPLPVPPADATLPEAAASPAVVLFVDRACAVRLDFHLSARNHGAIVKLVRVLEGMPLAIELAASRIRAFTPAQMLGKLGQPALAPGATPGLDLLSRPGPGPGSTLQSRHASMQRAIEWSWRQLGASQQQLAGAMAVFPGGCDAQMLAAVHGDGDTGAGLEQLHAQSLIHLHRDDVNVDAAWPPDGAPRFQLYEPIREYAAAQVAATHSSLWRARQRGWAVQWLRGLPATPPLAQVRAEITNLAAAFASAAADGAGGDAVALLLALHPLQEAITLPADTLAHARTAVQGCDDPSLRSRGCGELAPLFFTAGDTPEARRLAEAAVQAAPAQGPAQAWAWLALASVQWRGAPGSAEQVLPWLEQALNWAQAHPEPELLASALCQLALVRYGRDRDAEASRLLAARAQAVWADTGNPYGVNHARHNVAVFDFRAGRREQALASWDAIAAEAAVLQDTRRLAIANSARCAALSDMRRWPQARQALRESLGQSWRAMRLFDVSYDLWNLPRVLAHLRQPEDAICLMAFAAQFWESRFGRLTDADRRYVRMVERLVTRQLDAHLQAAAAARGRQLPLSEAVALALAS